MRNSANGSQQARRVAAASTRSSYGRNRPKHTNHRSHRVCCACRVVANPTEVSSGAVARLFLSYANADKALAEEVLDWLDSEGHTVFYAPDADRGTTLGDDWKQRLYRELGRIDAIVCVVTSAYLTSPWCTAEVAIADSRGCRLLPLRFEQGVMHTLMEHVQYASFDIDPGRRTRAVVRHAAPVGRRRRAGLARRRQPVPRPEAVHPWGIFTLNADHVRHDIGHPLGGLDDLNQPTRTYLQIRGRASPSSTIPCADSRSVGLHSGSG